MKRENTKKGKTHNAAFSKTFEKEREQQVNSKEELEKREQKLREDPEAREEKLKEDLKTFDKQREKQQKLLNGFPIWHFSRESSKGSTRSIESRISKNSFDNKLMALDPKAEVNISCNNTQCFKRCAWCTKILGTRWASMSP